MPRLPYPDPTTLSPQVQTMLRDRLPLNIYRILGNAPTIMPGWFALGRGILYESDLDPALRELAVLRVGYLSHCAYEVHQHRRLAASIGLSAEKIAATERSADPGIYDERELLVLRMTEQLVLKVKADSDLFAATVAKLGAQQTMELMVVVGFYMMAARIMENTEIEIEAGGGPSVEEAKRLRAEVAARIAREAAAANGPHD